MAFFLTLKLTVLLGCLRRTIHIHVHTFACITTSLIVHVHNTPLHIARKNILYLSSHLFCNDFHWNTNLNRMPSSKHPFEQLTPHSAKRFILLCCNHFLNLTEHAWCANVHHTPAPRACLLLYMDMSVCFCDCRHPLHFGGSFLSYHLCSKCFHSDSHLKHASLARPFVFDVTIWYPLHFGEHFHVTSFVH